MQVDERTGAASEGEQRLAEVWSQMEAQVSKIFPKSVSLWKPDFGGNCCGKWRFRLGETCTF